MVEAYMSYKNKEKLIEIKKKIIQRLNHQVFEKWLVMSSLS